MQFPRSGRAEHSDILSRMAHSHSDPLITVMSPHVGPEQCRSAHPQAGFESTSAVQICFSHPSLETMSVHLSTVHLQQFARSASAAEASKTKDILMYTRASRHSQRGTATIFVIRLQSRSLVVLKTADGRSKPDSVCSGAHGLDTRL